MDGFTKVPNGILEALARQKLTIYEWRVLFVIFRLVMGWRKRSDWISLSQFSRATGLDRANIYRALRMLEARAIVVVSRDNRKRPKYSINHGISDWRVLSRETTPRLVVRGDNRVLSNATTEVSSLETTKLSSQETPTKERKEKKEIITKESTHPIALGASGGASSSKGNSRTALKSLFAEYLEARARSNRELSYSEWIRSSSAPES